MTANRLSATARLLKKATHPWTDWRDKRFWLLAAFLAYSLLGFYAAPPLVQRLAVSGIEATGREARLERVRFNPWTLTLLAGPAEVRDSDGEVIVAFDEFLCNFQASSLFRRAWTFREIGLLGLFIHEERFTALDTRLTRWVDSMAGPAGSAPEPGNGGLPRLIVDQFRLLDGHVAYTDRVAGDFEGVVGPVNVEIHDLRTLPDHAGLQSVTIHTAHGGVVEWHGSLHAVPLASKGHLSMAGRGLTDVYLWADHLLPFDILGDDVEIELDYALDLGGGEFSLALDHLQARFLNNRVRLDGGEADILAIRELNLTEGMLRWPDRTVRIEAIDIEGLDLKAGLAPDGSLDLLALVPERADTPPPPETGPVALEVGVLRVPDASIRLNDARLSPPAGLSLEDLRLELSGIDNRAGTAIPVNLATRLGSGGQVRYRGDLTLFPEFQTSGRLTLEAVQLPVAQPYVETRFRVRLEGGTLDLEADLEHGPGQPARLAGGLGVTGLLVHDGRKDQRLLAWDALRLDRLELDLAANRLDTSKLDIQGLFGRLHIAEDLSTNVSGLVVETAGDAQAAEAAPALKLQLGGVRVEAGALDFSDHSLPLPFAAAIRQLNGEISTLSTTSGTPSEVNLEGQVNEFGLARIDGQLNPWAPTDLADVDLAFRNLELSRLTPYTIQFAGYRIDDGRMDVDLGYHLDQQRLRGDNRIVISDIRLGEKVDHPDAGSLPLGLAVALLTDAEGVIDLDVPVEGDLNDPKFRIGGVVMQALGNLITKAVTAPFRLLGRLVGVDSERFGTLGFAAGRSDISPPDREQLLKLGEAMLQRPELTVRVGGVFATGPDSVALARRAVASRIEERGAELPARGDELSTDHERRVLESLAAERLPSVDLLAVQATHSAVAGEEKQPELDLPAYLAELRARLVAAEPIGEAELMALAEARAQAVLETLRESRPETEFKIEADGIREVDTDDPQTIPLELGVSAGD